MRGDPGAQDHKCTLHCEAPPAHGQQLTGPELLNQSIRRSGQAVWSVPSPTCDTRDTILTHRKGRGEIKDPVVGPAETRRHCCGCVIAGPRRSGGIPYRTHHCLLSLPPASLQLTQAAKAPFPSEYCACVCVCVFTVCVCVRVCERDKEREGE